LLPLREHAYHPPMAGSWRLAWVALWICACGDDDRGVAPVSSAGTEECDSIAICDIAEMKCVQSVLEATSCERGDETPPLPETRSLDAAAVEAELVAKALAAGRSAHGAFDAGLRRLHLLSPGESSIESQVHATVAAIAAYYDPETMGITIIEDATDEEDDTRMYLLSHELTHYLQDRDHMLDQLLEDHSQSSDQRIAIKALIEGEALVNSTRFLVRLARRSPRNLQWDSVFDMVDAATLEEIKATSSPLSAAALNLPYTIGGRYVAEVWDDYDRDHVEGLYETPPLALIDWLSGYGDGRPNPTQIEALDCAPPLAPDGWQLAALDSLGVTGIVALMGATGSSSLRLAEDLVGDALAVYVRGDAAPESSVLIWRLRFRTADAARGFEIRLPWGDVHRDVKGRELTLSVGPDISRDAGLVGFDGCPRLSELTPTQNAPGVDSLRRTPTPSQILHRVVDRAHER
jgi:hypothetical protein